MIKSALKEFLDFKATVYENPDFISDDPIQIPHRYTQKMDIEISGFLTAVIAWGNRKSIINNAMRLMHLMDNAPGDFVLHHTPSDLNVFEGFVHRTFNAIDLRYFIQALQNLYSVHGGLESQFKAQDSKDNMPLRLHHFKKRFFELPHEKRTEKHLPDPLKGSAAKRLNMFLRWMVRSPAHGVDFGIWPSVSPAQLSCPLDVHTGNVARTLGLLQRKSNDARALEELDAKLRELDVQDPVKYDFALFGLGVYENFKG